MVRNEEGGRNGGSKGRTEEKGKVLNGGEGRRKVEKKIKVTQEEKEVKKIGEE